MRSVPELLAELKNAARGIKYAGIIVSIGEGLDLVFYPDPDGRDPLTRLQELMAEGGRAIGFLRCAKVAGIGSLTIQLASFPELGNEPSVLRTMEKAAKLLEQTAESLGSRTGRPNPKLN